MLPLESNKIYDMYYNKQLSTNAIATKINVSKKSVQRFMKNNNIPLRTNHEAICLMHHQKRMPLYFKGNEIAIGYLLGVYQGDGTINKSLFNLTAKDKSFIDRTINNLKSLKLGRHHISKTKTDLISLNINNFNFAEFLSTISFEQLSHNQKIEFINGFYDSEGSIYFKERKKSIYQRTISCLNTDKKLLEEIQKFLHSLNINSHLRVNVKKGASHKYKNMRITATKDCFNLGIFDARSQKLFCKHFKLFRRKQKLLDKIKKEVNYANY